MDSLEELHLTKTSFVDTIPTMVAQLTNLRMFQLSGPNYYGTLPSELGRMTQMVDFKIENTQIQGTLPSEYVHMQPIQFQFSNNFLTGTIPTELGLLSQVEFFYLDRNALVCFGFLACDCSDNRRNCQALTFLASLAGIISGHAADWHHSNRDGINGFNMGVLCTSQLPARNNPIRTWFIYQW